MTVVDTHTHAGINWFEPVEMLLHQMTLNEVDHAVLIQHGRPEYGTYDHSYLYECVDRFPGKFEIIAIVDSKKTNSLQELEEHKKKRCGWGSIDSEDPFSRARQIGYLAEGSGTQNGC